jgi:hypothetical protein
MTAKAKANIVLGRHCEQCNDEATRDEGKEEVLEMRAKGVLFLIWGDLRGKILTPPYIL